MNSSLLTSVVVAAIVASVVSGFFTSVTVILERRARRKELIFTKAIELAQAKIAFLSDYAKNTGTQTFIADPADYSEWYYTLLNNLHDKGELPTTWEADYEARFSKRLN